MHSLFKKQKRIKLAIVSKVEKHIFFTFTKCEGKILFSLNENETTDNKKFWKTVKPFLVNKTISLQSIAPNENERLIYDRGNSRYT